MVNFHAELREFYVVKIKKPLLSRSQILQLWIIQMESSLYMADTLPRISSRHK